jgi:hypothetical protein
MFEGDERKNFFDFKRYFFHNYVKKNRGLNLTPSHEMLLRNEGFQQGVIDLVDFLERETKILLPSFNEFEE